jgi:hypothetical protein
MSSAKLSTFDQALQASSSGRTRPHLLLGNGFSRAWRDDLFAYDALYEQATFDELSPAVPGLFDSLGTRDFEVAMRALRTGAEVLRVYGPQHGELHDQIRRDAEGLKGVLVRAIAGNHPSRPADVSTSQYAACKKFLSNFARIYTLNYDLLLYWTLMQSDIAPYLACDDGFRRDEHSLTPFITWVPQNRYEQNVYFLHGGLHLFDSGSTLEKYTWTNTGVPLMDQIRLALDAGKYPVFVAEGSSDSKLQKIRHQAYLSAAERSLVGIGGTLFVYGLSMSESDEHVLSAIEANQVKAIFVSVFGDPDSASNQMLISRAKALAVKRGDSKSLAIHFYNAESATVWG